MSNGEELMIGAWPTLVKYRVEYLASRLKDLAVLKVALKELDFKALHDHAHNWKGTSRPYGFPELEVLAHRLEESAKREDEASCGPLLNEVEDALNLRK